MSNKRRIALKVKTKNTSSAIFPATTQKQEMQSNMSILIEVYLFQFLVVVASFFANIGSSKLLAGQTAWQSHIREKEAEKKLEKEETFSEIQSWFAAFTFLKRERLDARVKVLKKEKNQAMRKEPIGKPHESTFFFLKLLFPSSLWWLGF